MTRALLDCQNCCVSVHYIISSQTGMEQLERVTDHLFVDLLMRKQEEKRKSQRPKLDHFALNRLGAAEDVESVVNTISCK